MKWWHAGILLCSLLLLTADDEEYCEQGSDESKQTEGLPMIPVRQATHQHIENMC